MTPAKWHGLVFCGIAGGVAWRALVCQASLQTRRCDDAVSLGREQCGRLGFANRARAVGMLAYGIAKATVSIPSLI